MLTAPHARRIVRRAMLAVAAAVLLLVLYVGGSVAFVFCCGAGWIPPAQRDAMYPLYAPLDVYVNYRLPGSDLLVVSFNRASKAGHRHYHP